MEIGKIRETRKENERVVEKGRKRKQKEVRKEGYKRRK